MIQVSMAYLNGEGCQMYRDLIQNFKLNLDKNKVYDVGIDQSTTCTGIAICPLDNSFTIVIEVFNFDRDAYYVPQLCNFIRRIFSDVQLRYLVIEEPLGYISGRRNATLTKLKKTLVPLKDELNIKHFDTILPPSWRHGLMPEAGKGDRRKKDTVVNAVLELYPSLESSLPYWNTDYDGIESLGIIVGFKNRHGVDDSGGLKIIGPVNTKKRAIAFYKYMPLNEDFTSILESEMADFKRYVHHKDELHFKAYNEEHNLYGNVKMCLVDNYSCSIITDELDVLSICIEQELIPSNEKFMFMFVVNANKVSELMIRDLYSNGYSPVLY